jgi:anti-sigma-K factor RskA
VALIADNTRLAFLPSNLPAAPAGRTYQLWLIRERIPAVVSAGTFNGAARDVPTVQFGNKQLMSGIKAITVTLEPAEGSAVPTGHKLMVGTPKS